jgi:hypothetical protein
MQFVQSFETSNSIRFAGQAVTLSFYARKGANYSPTSSYLNVYGLAGTGTDQSRASSAYTGETSWITNQNVTLTSTWQRFTLSGTVAATATEVATYFAMTPTGTASTNDYFEITGVQLEIGTATTFARAGGTIQGELAACQRYYIRYTASGVYSIFAASAFAYSAVVGVGIFVFPVEMRTTPTALDSSTLAFSKFDNTHYTASAVTYDGGTTSPKVCYVYGTIAGATAGNIGYFGANNSATAYVGFSAEL